MVRFNAFALAILGLTLFNAVRTEAFQATSRLNDVLRKLEILESYATVLEDTVSELNRHRKLASDCEFRKKGGSCSLSKDLILDDVVFEGEVTMEKDVEMEGDLDVKDKATFKDDLTLDVELDCKDEAFFDGDVEFKKSIKMDDLDVDHLHYDNCRGCD